MLLKSSSQLLALSKIKLPLWRNSKSWRVLIILIWLIWLKFWKIVIILREMEPFKRDKLLWLSMPVVASSLSLSPSVVSFQKDNADFISTRCLMVFNIFMAKVLPTETWNQRTCYLMNNSFSSWLISAFLLTSKELISLVTCTLFWVLNLTWLLKLPRETTRVNKLISLLLPLCCSLCWLDIPPSWKLTRLIHSTNFWWHKSMRLSGRLIPEVNQPISGVPA